MLTFCLFVTIAQTFCYTIPPSNHYERDNGMIIERSTEMITRYEGCSLTAYKDTRWYSIGYGTRSFNGEVITQQEAWNRMEVVVAQSVHRIMRDFPRASESEVVALTSLYYNCWSGYLKVKKIWYRAWLQKWFCELPWYSWLTQRRNEEKYLLWYSME